MSRPPGASEDPGVAFPATRWTLVGRAGGADAVAQPLAIVELVRMYAPALRAHLLQSLRYDEHRADDLLQGFLADKVLEQRLIGHADRQRGRFRTFLLTALDRYVVDEHRRAAAAKRSPRGRVLDIDDQRDILPTRADAPGRHHAFDVAFAGQVLGEVLAMMRRLCEQTDRTDLWHVFEARYFKPATENVAPEPHESLAKRLGLASAREAANLLVTAKRMFTRMFKSAVARYASDEEEIRGEVTELWRIFAAGEP